MTNPNKTEPSSSESEGDFSLWEDRYGRKLTDEERREIKYRLLELLKLTEEVYKSKQDYFDGFLDGIKSVKSASFGGSSKT